MANFLFRQTFGGKRLLQPFVKTNPNTKRLPSKFTKIHLRSQTFIANVWKNTVNERIRYLWDWNTGFINHAAITSRSETGRKSVMVPSDNSRQAFFLSICHLQKVPSCPVDLTRTGHPTFRGSL
jgi:hypothetical protein